MNAKIIPIIASIAAAGLLPAVIPAAHAVNVPSTATILGVCGLAVTPPAIDYGVLAPGAVSSQQTVELTNTGNVQAAVLVRGTDWSTASIANAMPVTATRYSLASGDYASKTALTGIDEQLTNLTPLESRNTYWQLSVILSDPAAVGPTTQVLTVTERC